MMRRDARRDEPRNQTNVEVVERVQSALGVRALRPINCLKGKRVDFHL